MKKRSLVKINLGCGPKKLDGWINVDIEPSVKPDIVADFNDTLPLYSNCADEIQAITVIEHIRNLGQFFNELYRVLARGGGLFIFLLTTRIGLVIALTNLVIIKGIGRLLATKKIVIIIYLMKNILVILLKWQDLRLYMLDLLKVYQKVQLRMPFTL